MRKLILLICLAIPAVLNSRAASSSYTITIPTGGAYVANQLDHGGNTLNEVLPAVPDGTILYKWNCQGYVPYTYDGFSGVWVDGVGNLTTVKLAPGEGALMANSGAPFNVTFSGAAHVPVLPLKLLCGCGSVNSLASRQTNGPGTFENIMGVAPTAGTTVLRWTGNGSITYSFNGSVWSPSPPAVNVGESVFVSIPCATNSCITLLCPPDKTAECGDNWNYDLPAVYDPCCGTNFTVTVFSTTSTNLGPCLQLNTRTWQATDCANSVAFCSQKVSIIDTRPPVLTCASNKIVTCDKTWVFDPPTAIDACCGSNVTIVILGTITNTFCPPTAVRTWQATDCCGNSVACSQTVTMLDSIAPSITCASNKTVQCGSTWNFDTPTAFDACCGANVTISVLNTVTNGTGCALAITRTWQAMDCCGNPATCSQTVTLIDTTPPVITCASNKTVQCGSAWSFDTPTAFDSCCGANVTVSVLNTVTNGTGCALAIIRTWQATDCCGNPATCSQTVTLIDTTAPTINCPTNQQYVCPVWVYFSATATDACDPQPVVTYTPPSGTFFLPGVTTVNCSAVDACGNSNHCSFNVTVLSNCVSCTSNLLVNGSFEIPGVPDGYVALPGGSTIIQGWTTLSNGVQYYNPVVAPSFVNTGFAADGVYLLDLAPAGSIGGGIQQSFATVPGRTYHAVFRMGTSRERGRNGTASLVASVTGDVPRVFNMATGAAQIVWEQRSFDFIASGTSSTLAFTTTDDPAQHFVNLDDVRVTDCALPFCVDLTWPTNLFVPCAGSNGAWANFNVAATNRCSTNTPVVWCEPPSGSLFPPGITPVRCTVLTDGETQQCSFAVTVLSNCPASGPHFTFTGQPSDIRLRLDRVFYGPANQLLASLDLGAHLLGTGTVRVMLISEKAGDVEVISLHRTAVEHFDSDTPIALQFGAPTLQLDAHLQVAHGDTIWAFWQVAGLVGGPPVTENIVAAFGVAADGLSADAPQYVAPDIAMTADERVVPPGGKPIATLFVPGTIPVQLPVDELIAYPETPAELEEITNRTGGSVLASDLLPEEQAQGKVPKSYLVHLNPLLADPAELPAMRAFVGATEPLLASSDLGLRILALALKLQLQGYHVGLNPRLQYQGVPAVSPTETSHLPQSLTHPLFDLPRVWAFMALMDVDTDAHQIPVAFLDQGFSPNRDFRRPPSGVFTECDFEGRTFADLFRGFACAPGRAETPPTVGGSFFLEPVWHGNGVVSIAGGVINNGYGVSGTGGQVVTPMLYRYGTVSYAFEMGLGMRKAVADGAKVINLSAGFPCRINTWLGDLDPNWCDPLGRTAFCFELPAHMAVALGSACARAVSCDVPIICDIIEGIAGLVCGTVGGVVALGTITPACLLTVPAGDLRHPLDTGIQVATDAGVPVVTVAGNALRAEDLPAFIRPVLDLSDRTVEGWRIEPAMNPNVIVCASTESDFPFENWDFYGARVDIWAPVPGSYMAPPTLTATEPDDTHQTLNTDLYGTSAAVPYITGLIADMMALNPRLDPGNLSLTPAQRGRIPAIIRALLHDTAYTPTELTSIANTISPALGTATFNAGLIRRSLVNPPRLVRAAALQTLEGMSAPALPDFTAWGYDGQMNFDETTPAVAADDAAHARTMSPGVVYTGSIIRIRGEGVSDNLDSDFWRVVMPSSPPGLYRAQLTLAYPDGGRWEALGLTPRGGFDPPEGLRVLGSDPNETHVAYTTPPIFFGSEFILSVPADTGADNVYKLQLTAPFYAGPLPAGDRFDSDTPANPPESRPRNDTSTKAVKLGVPGGEFAWLPGGAPGSGPLEAWHITLPNLNFDQPLDQDWFRLDNFPDYSLDCPPDLAIKVPEGVEVTVYDRTGHRVGHGFGPLVSVQVDVLGLPPVYIQLTPQDHSRYLEYDLNLVIRNIAPAFCDVLTGMRERGVIPGGSLGGSGSMFFPKYLPDLINFGVGAYDHFPPRQGDPAGRIITPEAYFLKWVGQGPFTAEFGLDAGASLRIRLTDLQGIVLAEANTPDLVPGAPSNSLPVLSGRQLLTLTRNSLPPGDYLLEFSLGRLGTMISAVLPYDAITDSSLSLEELKATPIQEPPLLSLRAVTLSGALNFHWPLSQTPIQLEEATELGAQGHWTAVGMRPALVGEEKQVAIPMSGARRYFRLRIH